MLWGMLIPIFDSQAQFHIGAEIGTAISAVVPSNQSIPVYAQRISPRAGLYGELDVHTLFSFRTGIFYSLRGFEFGIFPNNYNTDKFWDLHCLAIPLMLVFKPSKQVQVALGLEWSNVVHTNLPLIQVPSLLFGLRGACGFHITKQLRVSAYYTYSLTKLLETTGVSPSQKAFYNNILAGISMACVLTTFPKKIKKAKEYCPPYL